MKKIIGMHFGTKNYLKSTRNHTAKHAQIIKSMILELVTS
jgi:hypothetical protein